MIRAFIAVDLSEDAKKEIKRVQGFLSQTDDKVKWTSMETLHLTLRFLGDIQEHNVEVIKGKLDKAVNGQKAFNISLNDIGVFPGWDRPRIIWVGISEGRKAIVDLAEKINKQIPDSDPQAQGKEFRLHITIGRVKALKNKEKLKSAANNCKIQSKLSIINEIVLYRSELTRNGAIHTPLDSWDLL